MAIKNKEMQAEFRAMVEKSGLMQRQLAGMLDKHETTVSRWLSDREDAVDPPVWAAQFVRAYLMLAPADRAKLERP